MVMLDQPAIYWPKHGKVRVRMGVQVTLLHSFIFVSTVQVRIVSFFCIVRQFARNAGLSAVHLLGLCGFGIFSVPPTRELCLF